MILVQITTNAAVDTLSTVADTGSVQVIDLLFKGGIMMIPIALLSLVAVYVFVERVRTLKQALLTPEGFMDKVKSLVSNGDLNGAKLACAEVDTPASRMIEKGLSRIGHPLKNIEVSIENVGKIELYKLERNLPLIATVSGAAPMLGFLGTVIGMIQAFMSIAQEEGAVSPKLLSAGIYEAMVTTAAGLLVGIIAYLGYNYLVTRLQKAVHTMEYSSIEFIDLLQESK